MLEKIGYLNEKVHRFWGKYNPDLYSANDAKHALSTVSDREYFLGSSKINPRLMSDRCKIWSLEPEILATIRSIVKDAGHVHVLPFVLGTYSMDDQKMRMNDLCLTDPYMGYLMASHGLEGFVMPFLRGLYYIGRPSWWRHESIHARHHHQMAYFLDATDPRRRSWREWDDGRRLEEAAFTIHEAGIEELLTRWQTIKESRGMREKVVSSLAILFYMEYAPFTGIRNIFIDGKEKTMDLIPDGKLRIPAKIAATVGTLALPMYMDNQTGIVQYLGEAISQILPVSGKQVEGLFWRGDTYVFVAVLSAMFSTKEKGAFEKKEANGKRLTTNEYKFPYAYNPITSIGRSIGFLKYLTQVWDQIPNYRVINSPQDIDSVTREIDNRIRAKIGDRQHQFTMQLVEDALRPFEGRGRSSFPQHAFVKGMFTPAMYLRLRELYHSPSV